MKAVFLIFIFALSLMEFSFGQCDTLRYRSPIFNTVTTHANVKYGSATVWSVPYGQTDLRMNVYTPDNDTLTKRPLMIWVHPGGFLNGSKEADDMVELCTRFAKKGYVTATIDYRKGFIPTNASSAERAVYRGVQDLRAAIRYLKEHHVVYGIDTNYTFIGGSSAGAFSVLHVVYMDQHEAPASIAAGATYPALGCLDCEGNDYNHAMNISGYVNLWGAIGDSTWINADETTPGLSIHGTADATVPFGVGHPFGVPLIPLTHGSRAVYNQLSSLNIPHTTYFVEGEGHEFHGASNGAWDNPPTAYWDTIFNLIETHYFNIITQDVQTIESPSVICAYDTVTFKVNIPNDYSLCWEVDGGTILHSAGDSVQVVFGASNQAEISVKQFTEIAAFNGKSTLNITIQPEVTVDFTSIPDGLSVQFTPTPTGFMNYNWSFGDGNYTSMMSPLHTYGSPGIYEVSLKATMPNGCIARQHKVIDLSTSSILHNSMSSFEIYPNPAQKMVNITWEKSVNGEISLYNMQGELMFKENIKEGQSELVFNIENLSPGSYLIVAPKLSITRELIVQ